MRRLLLRHHLADFLAEHPLDFVLHRFGAGFAVMRPHKVVVHPGRNKTILGSTEKVEYLMNTDVLSVKIGCFCRNIFRNYRFLKIEKDPK